MPRERGGETHIINDQEGNAQTQSISIPRESCLHTFTWEAWKNTWEEHPQNADWMDRPDCPSDA
eukprot:2470150-Pyramimonas_sp.AAC.1